MSTKTQFNIWYWVAAFIGLLVFQYLFTTATQIAEIPYSQFESFLEQGKIAEVAVSESFIQGRLNEPIDGRSLFITTRVEPDLARALQDRGVVVTGQIESTFLRDLLSWIFPVVLFFGLWMFISKRMGSLPGGGLMQIGKSKAKVYVEQDTGVSFADVAGAIETATSKGGKFYNMTNQLAETAPGKLLGLQGTFEGLTATIGVGMLEAMVPLIDLGQWLMDSPALLSGLGAAIASLTAGIAIWQVVTKWATISQWLLNIAVMWPVLVIAVLIGAIVALVARYKGWGDATKSLGTVLKAWFGNLGIYFKDFFQETGYKLELFVLKIKSGFQFVGGMVGNLVKAIKLATEFKFGEAKQALTAEIKTKATAEIEALEQKRNGQRTQNLADFKANLDTIKNTSILGKLSLRKEGKGKSASDVGLMAGLGLGGLSTTGAGSATAPGSASDTAKGITGGGVRNMTINVGKFFDDLHFHAASTDEGMQELESKFKEMFMRVVNSGNAAIAN